MKFYIHPAFIDVIMGVSKVFPIPTKDLIELKVTWFHKRHGYEIASEKIRITKSKWQQFTLLPFP